MKSMVKSLIVSFALMLGAASLSFNASAEEYEAAGTLCDPINTYAPASAEKLRKFNGEIRNIASTGGTVGVICPILNDPSGTFQDFYVGIRNLGDVQATVVCTLHEVSDGTKINSWVESVMVPAGGEAEPEWLGIDVQQHTFWHVYCQLPPRTGVTHMHTFDSII